MKKFSESQNSVFESFEPLDFEALFEKISPLKSWLYKSTGLGLMSIIDEIFAEENYTSPLNQKQIDKFNFGVELLKRTSMPLEHINSRISQKLPGGIQNAKLVLNENGEWHYVNKLNTNYLDLSDLLVELIKRGTQRNYSKGKVVYDSIMKDPIRGLLNIKPHLKRLIIYYFVQNGLGLQDFKKLTRWSKKMSDVGEIAEDSVSAFLQLKRLEIAYSGGNGDFIDMVFGVDLITFCHTNKNPDLIGYKSIQVKNRIDDWSKLSYYKVDIIAETNPIRFYNLKDKSILEI
jgi:hypothetical protein